MHHSFLVEQNKRSVAEVGSTAVVAEEEEDVEYLRGVDYKQLVVVYNNRYIENSYAHNYLFLEER